MQPCQPDWGSAGAQGGLKANFKMGGNQARHAPAVPPGPGRGACACRKETRKGGQATRPQPVIK